MQTIINPLVVSVGPTNEAIITPVPMTHHGGGVKKVVAVLLCGAHLRHRIDSVVAKHSRGHGAA